jgi:hypothetical protein
MNPLVNSLSLWVRESSSALIIAFPFSSWRARNTSRDWANFSEGVAISYPFIEFIFVQYLAYSAV